MQINALQNYLSVLGLTAPTQPSLEFVTELQRKHVTEFSFNSLAVVLASDISLELAAISEKIVSRRLGGYCFEHNKLTFELLNALGYDVQIKLARVLNNNLDKAAARTHRVTVLTLDNVPYLIDTGFGGNGPMTPLRLDTDVEQLSGFERYRIVSRANDEFDLQFVKDGDYFTLYRFDLAHYSEADCALGHFYSHKNPSAVFVNNLMVTRKEADKTRSLLNAQFTIRTAAGEQIQRVDTPTMLQAILSDEFHIELETMMAEHLFARFISPALNAAQTSDTL